MSYTSKIRSNQFDTGQLAAAGAAATVFPGNKVDNRILVPGSLMAKMTATIATASLTQAPSWQVSSDGTNWEAVRPMNNAANVALTATATINLEGPPCLQGRRYVRAVFTSAGATATTGDFYQVSYSYQLV